MNTEDDDEKTVFNLVNGGGEVLDSLTVGGIKLTMETHRPASDEERELLKSVLDAIAKALAEEDEEGGEG